jgi:peptide/nickel transport system permease protein
MTTVVDAPPESPPETSAPAAPDVSIPPPVKRKPWGKAFWIAVTWLILVVAATTVANVVNWEKPTDFLGAPVLINCSWRDTTSLFGDRSESLINKPAKFTEERDAASKRLDESTEKYNATVDEYTAVEAAGGDLGPVEAKLEQLERESAVIEKDIVAADKKIADSEGCASAMRDWKASGGAKGGTFARPLGLNFGGNDILVDLVKGAKNSLIIAAATVVFGFIVGGTLGMIAGYFKGKADTGLSFMTNVLLSLPPLLFILLLISVLSGSKSGEAQGLSSSVTKVSLSLGILSIPTIYRVVRASTLQYSQREFVMAARSMGAKVPRILIRELLPNVAKPMLAFGLVAAGTIMVVEGSLSFLGVGVGSGTDSTAWGKQIAQASQRADLEQAPLVAGLPALALFLTVLSFNYIGDKVRERLETKQGAL